MTRVGIGIIGCGNISAAYLKAAKAFPILDVKAVADLDPSAAEARGAEFGIPARSVEALLADPSIEIVVNLTVTLAHVAVGLQAIAAGKHVHSEKPLGISTAEARPLLEAGEKAGLRVGAAPDTFLGGAHQTCRKLVDDGAIGRPLAGTAFFMCPGHERWHPNPGFYYLRGGGPMLDMGPYYITALVNLLGPVSRVAGITGRARPERLITSEPLKGTTVPVEVATHAAGTLEFVSGASTSRATAIGRSSSTAPTGRWRCPTPTGSAARSRSARRPATGGRRSPSTPTPTAISASSAPPTWRTPSAPAGRTGRAATSPSTCWR